jgi:hypothetical protein
MPVSDSDLPFVVFFLVVVVAIALALMAVTDSAIPAYVAVGALLLAGIAALVWQWGRQLPWLLGLMSVAVLVAFLLERAF